MYNQNDLFGDIQGAQRSTVGGMMPTKPNVPQPSPLFPQNTGIVPPGPKQHNFDEPGGGGGPMGFPGGDNRGPGGGPMPSPQPWWGSRGGSGKPPIIDDGPNPWQGGGPLDIGMDLSWRNRSTGNPTGPDGRGFGGGGPMGFPGGDNRGPGGGPMPFPPGGIQGGPGSAPYGGFHPYDPYPNAVKGGGPVGIQGGPGAPPFGGGPWGGNPNSYGPAEGFQKPFGLPQENQMQPFGGPHGMRDRQGPWSRRLGQAPQGPGLFNPQPQEQQQMNPWLRNYLLQRRGL